MPPPPSSTRPNIPKKGAAEKAAEGKTNGTNGTTATPVNGTSGVDGEKKMLGKPDQQKYNAEQDALNKEIAEVKTKLDAIRSRIALSQAPAGSDRRTTIKSEMDGLRAEQGKYKSDRQRIFDEMKRLQEGVGRKIKDAQAQRSKQSYKNVGEVDQRIEALNKQIESGSMKLVDEKKALAEITTLRRSRKALESSGSVDDAINSDKVRIDELKAMLDDPEAKKASDKFDALKKEMDGLREEGNKAYEERNKLFEERNTLSAQMDDLYGKKRDAAQKHREENDQYYAKIQADRQARHERFKAEKAQEDTARREQEIIRLREEAKMPAYSSEIEDCSVLIGWFKGRYGGGEVPATNAGGKEATAQLQGIKELEIRKVESDFAGMTLKKKDDELDGMFGGSPKGGKKKGKKAAGVSVSGSATPLSGSSEGINLPMSLLTALLALGIPPPSGKDDVQRTTNDLETKKAWYEANSESKTKAEMEKVEKLVAKMQKKNGVVDGAVEGDDDALADADETETGGQKEPTHTVAVAGEAKGVDIVEDAGEQLPTTDASSEEVQKVDSALEQIKEGES